MASQMAAFKVAAEAGLRRRRLSQIASADQDDVRRTRRLLPSDSTSASAPQA